MKIKNGSQSFSDLIIIPTDLNGFNLDGFCNILLSLKNNKVNKALL
jgi:hypothetical protein